MFTLRHLTSWRRDVIFFAWMMVAHAYARACSKGRLCVFHNLSPLSTASPRRSDCHVGDQRSPIALTVLDGIGRMTLMDHKLKDLGPKLKSFDIRGAYAGWLHRYHAKYIEPGSFTPIIHCILLVGGIGYAIEWTFKGRMSHHSHIPTPLSLGLMGSIWNIFL